MNKSAEILDNQDRQPERNTVLSDFLGDWTKATKTFLSPQEPLGELNKRNNEFMQAKGFNSAEVERDGSISFVAMDSTNELYNKPFKSMAA